MFTIKTQQEPDSHPEVIHIPKKIQKDINER